MAVYPKRVYPKIADTSVSDTPCNIPYPTKMEVRKSDKVVSARTTYVGGIPTTTDGVSKQK